MKKLLVSVALFVLLSGSALTLRSLDTKLSRTQKVYKIVHLSGLSEIATIPSNDIIPTFQFAMPTIPETEWERLRKYYDSAKIVQDIAKSLLNEFTKEEIDRLYELIEPFGRMEIESEPDTSVFSNYDIALNYLGALDTIISLIDKLIVANIDSLFNMGLWKIYLNDSASFVVPNGKLSILIDSISQELIRREKAIKEKKKTMPPTEENKSIWKNYFKQWKEFLEKSRKFFEKYKYFRQKYEKEILKDLKRRGFIQE